MILWEYMVFVIAFVVFMLVMWLTKWLIRYLRRVNLVVPDVHKEGRPLVPISGGLAVAGGTISGLMIFIFLRTFFPQPTDRLLLNSSVITSLFAGIITILIITLIGFLDDLIVKLNRQESGGLKQWQKPLLTIAAAVPLMAINAGTSTMVLPFIGRIDIGVIYPLLFVPLGVVGAANMVNLLGGFNGMETGMGAVAVGMLGLFSLLKGHYLAALISLMAFAALSAFYWYNKVTVSV